MLTEASHCILDQFFQLPLFLVALVQNIEGYLIDKQMPDNFIGGGISFVDQFTLIEDLAINCQN